MKNNLLITSATILSAILCSCNGNKEQTNNQSPKKLITYQVENNTSHTFRTFTGVARSVEEAELAFEVSGKLKTLNVIVGDKVQKGQILAALDQRGFQNSYQERLAQIERTKVKYERMQKAVSSNAISQQELTNAKADYTAALATLDNAKKALEDSVLRAPFDATIVAKYKKNHANIIAKDPILKLINPDKLEMVTHIPEKLISIGQKGMAVEIEFDALPGIIVPAKVSEISAESSNSTQTYPVTLQMDQLKRADGKLILPGMTGTARANKNAIPNQAISQRVGHSIPVTSIYVNEKDEEFVWVVNPENNTVFKKPVQTIELSQGGVLVKGLNGGEIIARSGVNHLQEGQKIRR